MKTRKVNAKEIGERIAQARKEAGGMKQRELADLLSVTERSIAAYEAGDVIPYRFMRQLEESLSRPAAWFLYGESSTPLPGGIEETLRRIEEAVHRLEDALESESRGRSDP